ncbi:MAG: phenylalanine--tRNA ligase subunit beta [Elusimicrobia bacterium]|jgi:phenylalanyl-tRNA synthetase beta chain|nr:phenylalanine--tRNA ligase subunit beta [Elusimicrobiota bacterium]
MKIPLKWLNEYVDTSGVSPHRLGEILTMRGLEVDSVSDTDAGTVIDIELTPNRGDCASVIGVAREVASALEKKINLPKVNYESSPGKESILLKIDIQNPEKCPVYHLQKINDITIGPSPEWMQKRLRACSVRPLNNIIDITNYVMLETGQPLHAFDAERISGDTVTVRLARAGESLLMLDGVQRKFDGGEVVIADKNGPIAAGGIMGGENSSVNDITKDILVESAYFSPQSISRAERTLNVKTNASYRFAREIDKGGILYALARTVELIKQLGKAEPAGEKLSFDTLNVSQKTQKKIKVDLKQLNSLLGTSVNKDNIKKYLRSINFGVEFTGSSFEVTVPSYRNDVHRPVDVIEEVARIHGYDRIDAKLPNLKTGTKYFEPRDPFAEAENALRARGYWESLTHTLTDSDKITGIYTNEFKEIKEKLVRLKNPISVDMDILRPSILPGLLKVAGYNANRKSRSLKFFEKGPVFFKKGNDFLENSHIAYTAAGSEYFEAKNSMEALTESLKQDYSFNYSGSSAYFKKGRSGVLSIDGKFSGEFGLVKESLLKSYNLNQAYTGGYLILDEVNKDRISNKRFKKWSAYPAIYRDISLICPAELTHKSIYDIIKVNGGGELKKAEVADSYIGEKIGAGKKSITYALEFNSEEKTLSSETLSSEKVDFLIEDILNELENKFGITLRPE